MIKARLTEKERIKEMLPIIIRKAINEGVKNDYLDLIVNEIHRYHSGITDIYRINSKAYTTVMLFNKVNPELFRGSIPEDAYYQLLTNLNIIPEKESDKIFVDNWPKDSAEQINWFRVNILRLLNSDQMKSLHEWLGTYQNPAK